jgi:hypothetical protein
MIAALLRPIRSLGPSGAASNALAALHEEEMAHRQLDLLERRMEITRRMAGADQAMRMRSTTTAA